MIAFLFSHDEIWRYRGTNYRFTVSQDTGCVLVYLVMTDGLHTMQEACYSGHQKGACDRIASTANVRRLLSKILVGKRFGEKFPVQNSSEPVREIHCSTLRYHKNADWNPRVLVGDPSRGGGATAMSSLTVNPEFIVYRRQDPLFA